MKHIILTDQATEAELREALNGDKVFGSPGFIRRTRKPELPIPTRFEPTEKKPGHIVI